MIGEMERQYTAVENERDALLSKVDSLEKELFSKEDIEENMWNEFQSKLNQWKEAVKERDTIIGEKESMIASMQQQLNAVKWR